MLPEPHVQCYTLFCQTNSYLVIRALLKFFGNEEAPHPICSEQQKGAGRVRGQYSYFGAMMKVQRDPRLSLRTSCRVASPLLTAAASASRPWRVLN